MKITFSQDLMNCEAMLYDKCFIYGLLDGEDLWYIGSTVDPCSRFLMHLKEQTHDTRGRIARMKRNNRELEMRLLDACDLPNRIACEANWISITDSANNTNRLTKHINWEIKSLVQKKVDK